MTTTRGKGTWAKGLGDDEVNFKFPLNKLFYIGISTRPTCRDTCSYDFWSGVGYLFDDCRIFSMTL